MKIFCKSTVCLWMETLFPKTFYQNKKYYLLGFWLLKLCYYLLEICSYEPIKSQQFLMQIQDSININVLLGAKFTLVYCGKVVIMLRLQIR